MSSSNRVRILHLFHTLRIGVCVSKDNLWEESYPSYQLMPFVNLCRLVVKEMEVETETEVESSNSRSKDS